MNPGPGAGRKIAGVILAAGTASRMGATKQLLLFREKPILAHVLHHARNAQLDPLIVVLGHGAGEVQRQIDFASETVVIAEDYALGQSASLKAGLSRVPSHCDGALFLLGDQPLVPSAVMDALVEAFYQRGRDIVIPTCQGRRGNPVLIGRSLFHRLGAVTGDTGARALFGRHTENIADVEVGDRSIFFDVDTWEDYRGMDRISNEISVI